MKVGDVLLFIGSNCVIDRVIRFWTHSKFTHAALAINESEFVEAWWDGVRKSNIDGLKNFVILEPITPLTVPVTREELVIEKKNLSSSTPEHKNVPTEVIHILLSEEQVEFTKHRVALEDVSIYKQQIEDIKHVEETLKREEPKVKISGAPKVSDELDLKDS